VAREKGKGKGGRVLNNSFWGMSGELRVGGRQVNPIYFFSKFCRKNIVAKKRMRGERAEQDTQKNRCVMRRQALRKGAGLYR